VSIRATCPAMVIGASIITRTRTGATGLPALIAVVAPRNILIVATLWLLGLADGIRPALNRQIVARLLLHRLLHRPALLIGIMLRTVLPLAALILTAAFELPAVAAANNLGLRTRLIILLTQLNVLWTRLIILQTRLIVLWTHLIVLRTLLIALRTRLIALRALSIVSLAPFGAMLTLPLTLLSVM
jgi:hypothetical protein